MDFKEPKIVCVMPCYNNGVTIAKSIECVINQNYRNWELVIVDDNSTDNSIKVIKKYLKHPKVSLLQNKTHRGRAYCKNRVLYKIKDKKWDWFTTHDATDISHPDRFAIYMASALNNLYYYIWNVGHGNVYDPTGQVFTLKNSDTSFKQAFISYHLFDKILGYFDSSVPFLGEEEYNYRFKEILTALLGEVIDKNPEVNVIDYCWDNKIFLGRLGLKFNWTYTWDYKIGERFHSPYDPVLQKEYKKTWPEKWSGGGIPIEKFYQDFTPHKEDL